MTTSSGRSFKPLDTMTEERPPSTTTPTESDATPITTPFPGDLASIVDFMRSMMQDRVEERHRYEEQNQRRIHAMSKHMELLERMMQERSEKDDKKDKDPVKLTCLSDSDDIESYLYYFRKKDDSLRNRYCQMGIQTCTSTHWQSATGLHCTGPGRGSIRQCCESGDTASLQH